MRSENSSADQKFFKKQSNNLSAVILNPIILRCIESS